MRQFPHSLMILKAKDTELLYDILYQIRERTHLEGQYSVSSDSLFSHIIRACLCHPPPPFQEANKKVYCFLFLK